MSGNSYLDLARYSYEMSRFLPSYSYDCGILSGTSTMTTDIKAFPYNWSRTFCGTATSAPRTYYTVANAASTPYHIALGAHGYSGAYDFVASLKAELAQHWQAASISLWSSKIAGYTGSIATLNSWLSSDYIDESLKSEVKALIAKSEAIEKLHEEIQNDKKSSPSEIEARLKVYNEQAAALDEAAAALDKRCKEAKAAEEKRRGEQAAADAQAAVDNAGSGSGAGGSTSVTTTEGDTEMNTAALATRYDVKAPSTTEMSPADISSIKTAASDSKKFVDALTKLNADNAAAFLAGMTDAEIDKFVSDIDSSDSTGEEDMKNMKAFCEKLEAALRKLRDANYLEDSEYKKASALVAECMEAVKDNFTDAKEAKIKSKLKELKNTYLTKTIDGETVVIGTQKHFDEKIKEKQKEATTKAVKTFWNDHKVKNTGKKVKDEKAALPEGLTYLPNSQQYQWKYDSTIIFKGKSYAELNKAIENTQHADKVKIIAKWAEVLKKLDENLEAEAAS